MSDVVDLTTRRQAKALNGLATPAAVLANHNPADDPPCAANLFHIHSRSLLALPFVTLPLGECEDWGDFWKRTTMWNDEPGKDGCADYQRGRRYVREAITAIISDGAQSRGLEMVVDAILERAFTRRGPGGRICRQVSSAERAFLHELCEIAVEAVRQKGMPTPRGA